MLDARDEHYVRRALRTSAQLFSAYMEFVSNGTQHCKRILSRARDARRIATSSKQDSVCDFILPMSCMSGIELTGRLVFELETSLLKIRETVVELASICTKVCDVADSLEAWLVNENHPRSVTCGATSERPSVEEILERVLELHSELKADSCFRSDLLDAFDDYEHIPVLTEAWIGRSVHDLVSRETAAWWADMASLEYLAEEL